MKAIRIIYNSFIWSLLIALFCFDNLWLQMRVNTGYIFMALWVVLSLLFNLIFRKQSFGFGGWFSLVNLVICVIITLVSFGWTRLQTVPAALIREGLHQNTLSFTTVNIVLLFIIIGGLLWIMMAHRHGKSYKQA